MVLFFFKKKTAYEIRLSLVGKPGLHALALGIFSTGDLWAQYVLHYQRFRPWNLLILDTDAGKIQNKGVRLPY